MDKYSFLNAAHTVYFAELYEQYLSDPDSVEPSWRAFFQGYDFGSESYGLNGEIVEGVSTQVPEHVNKEFKADILESIGVFMKLVGLKNNFKF